MNTEVVVAAAQMSANSEYMRTNAKRVRSKPREAAERGARISAFPECRLTPFFPLKNNRDFDDYLNRVPDAVTSTLVEAARDNGIAVILPYEEHHASG